MQIANTIPDAVTRNTNGDISINRPTKIVCSKTNNVELANEQILRFNKQLEAVAERSAEMYQMASLSRLHPDPQLKISAKGVVLIQNTAAANLLSVEYNGVHYTAADWWKYLAGVVNGHKHFSIEITCNNRRFLLHCNYITAEDSFHVYGSHFQSMEPLQVTAAVDSYNHSPDNYQSAEINHSTGNSEQHNYIISDVANRLSTLIENLQDGVIVEDEHRKLLITNQRFCEIFGLNDSPLHLIGSDCWKLTRWAMHLFCDAQGFLDDTAALIDKKERSLNRELLLKDGRVFKRDFIPIKNDAGGHMGNMWLFNDITESIHAKKALDNQRDFYENILNNLPADIVVLDLQQRYRFINPVSLKDPTMRKWIIGKTDDEYFTFQNRPLTVAEGRKKRFQEVLAEKKEVRWEEEAIDKNGIERVHLRIYYPVLNEEGNVLQVIGYGIEITERKYIEQQVKLSEKRYRELIQFSQGIIITHDLKGVVKSINPAVEKILEIAPDFIIGKNLVSFLPENDREAFSEIYISNIIEQGGVEGVFRIFSRSGKKVYLLYKNVVVDEPGSEPYVIGFAQDITERILAEKELEVARQVTEESSRAKERFLANMSHEIRTPMSGIIGISNLLRKTTLNSEQQNYLDMVLESANNLIVIINDILDLEKIVAGKLEFESIPFNITEKVQIVAESFRYKAEEKDIHLKVVNQLPPDLHVVGDPYRLSQILNNIINNAVKFTEQGSIVVSVAMIKKDEDEIEICYAISDTGIGISPDKISSIFDPYVQERSEISRKYGGTGLGLAICKNLVDMQGGVMEVESQPGIGSLFSVMIPYKKTTEKPLTIEEKLDRNLLEGKKILVAEDVEINQFLVRHILEGWNCEVTIVENGAEALEEVINHDFDLLLMDIQMPVMNGIEATHSIRKLPARKKAAIPIIALTANALKGDDEKYKAAGMNGYLTKPFNETALYSILVQILNNKIEMKEVERLPVREGNANQEAPALYNLSMLQGMSGGDASFVPMLVKLFIDTTAAITNQMEQALANNDWKTIGALAHKLKPTIDNMGIVSLRQMVREVEMQGKTGIENDWLEPKTRTIIATIADCREKLKQEFAL